MPGNAKQGNKLSERTELWDAMLGAEMRSMYFAHLAKRYRLAGYGVAVLAVAGSLAWLLSRQRGARDLYLRWQTLANHLTKVWQGSWQEEELPLFQSSWFRELQKVEAEVSRDSIRYPDDPALMGRCQNYVERQYGS